MRISVSPGLRAIPAQRVEIVPMAGRLVITLMAESRRLVAIADADSPLPAELHLELPIRVTRIFDTEGNPIP